MFRTTVFAATLLCLGCLTSAALGQPLAHWTFDNRADRFADVGPNGLSLTPVGAVAFAPGVSGSALSLNNGGKANADLSLLPGGTNVEELTISLWADMDDAATAFDNFWGIRSIGASDSNFVLENNGAAQTPALFQVNGGIPGGSSLVPGSPNIAGGGFRHLAVTMSQSADNLELFVDGNSVGSTGWNADAAVDFLTIGGRFNTGVRNINAELDDVQVYGSALGQPQIQTLFNNPGRAIDDQGALLPTPTIPPGDLLAKGLVAHWTFDDPANRFADSSPNDFTLTPVGTVEFASGIEGTDALSLNNGGKTNADFRNVFLPTDELSISMWADMDDNTTDFDDFWGILTEGASDSNFVLEINGGSQSPALFQTEGGIPGGSALAPGVPNISEGGFRHLVVTMSQDNDELKLFVDNQLIATAAWDGEAPIDWFTIGGRFNTGVRNINAEIDDVQIYNVALTNGEVQFLFENPTQTLPEATVIPEPGSLSLLGLFSLLSLTRRRTSKS